jgi:hypothetical protein
MYKKQITRLVFILALFVTLLAAGAIQSFAAETFNHPISWLRSTNTDEVAANQNGLTHAVDDSFWDFYDDSGIQSYIQWNNDSVSFTYPKAPVRQKSQVLLKNNFIYPSHVEKVYLFNPKVFDGSFTFNQSIRIYLNGAVIFSKDAVGQAEYSVSPVELPLSYINQQGSAFNDIVILCENYDPDNQSDWELTLSPIALKYEFKPELMEANWQYSLNAFPVDHYGPDPRDLDASQWQWSNDIANVGKSFSFPYFSKPSADGGTPYQHSNVKGRIFLPAEAKSITLFSPFARKSFAGDVDESMLFENRLQIYVNGILTKECLPNGDGYYHLSYSDPITISENLKLNDYNDINIIIEGSALGSTLSYNAITFQYKDDAIVHFSKEMNGFRVRGWYNQYDNTQAEAALELDKQSVSPGTLLESGITIPGLENGPLPLSNVQVNAQGFLKGEIFFPEGSTLVFGNKKIIAPPGGTTLTVTPQGVTLDQVDAEVPYMGKIKARLTDVKIQAQKPYITGTAKLDQVTLELPDNSKVVLKGITISNDRFHIDSVKVIVSKETEQVIMEYLDCVEDELEEFFNSLNPFDYNFHSGYKGEITKFAIRYDSEKDRWYIHTEGYVTLPEDSLLNDALKNNLGEKVTIGKIQMKYLEVWLDDYSIRDFYAIIKPLDEYFQFDLATGLIAKMTSIEVRKDYIEPKEAKLFFTGEYFFQPLRNTTVDIKTFKLDPTADNINDAIIELDADGKSRVSQNTLFMGRVSLQTTYHEYFLFTKRYYLLFNIKKDTETGKTAIGFTNFNILYKVNDKQDVVFTNNELALNLDGSLKKLYSQLDDVSLNLWDYATVKAKKLYIAKEEGKGWDFGGDGFELVVTKKVNDQWRKYVLKIKKLFIDENGVIRDMEAEVPVAQEGIEIAPGITIVPMNDQVEATIGAAIANNTEVLNEFNLIVKNTRILLNSSVEALNDVNFDIEELEINQDMKIKALKVKVSGFSPNFYGTIPARIDSITITKGNKEDEFIFSFTGAVTLPDDVMNKLGISGEVAIKKFHYSNLDGITSFELDVSSFLGKRFSLYQGIEAEITGLTISEDGVSVAGHIILPTNISKYFNVSTIAIENLTIGWDGSIKKSESRHRRHHSDHRWI